MDMIQEAVTSKNWNTFRELCKYFYRVLACIFAMCLLYKS